MQAAVLASVRRHRGDFNPRAALFSNGEQGGWWDPSDFSTMFQDAAGTTPVTAVGQAVGRILDKSGRGNHLVQITDASRPTLGIDSATGAQFLSFDGMDDFLRTAVGADVNFTSTDEITACAGLRKVSDAATGMLCELSTEIGNFNGVFALSAPSQNGANSYRFQSKGTLLVVSGTGIFAAAPDSAVLTGLGKVATDVATIRRNGIVVEATTSDQGTGNYGTFPLFVGRRGGTTLPFNGRLHQLIIRNVLTSGITLTQVERFVGQKTGVLV